MGSGQSSGVLEHAFTDEGMNVRFGGKEPRLVVSIDIGATQSAVVVALLEPSRLAAHSKMLNWNLISL